ncbi:MAG: hypothetical protein NTV34_00410 [Proteobacteria bacterium]|nr:hypothetical protein [Pseudomonadota bacterium]
MKMFKGSMTSLFIVNTALAIVVCPATSVRASTAVSTDTTVVPEGEVPAAVLDPTYTLDQNSVVPEDVARPDGVKVKEEVPLFEQEAALAKGTSASVAEPKAQVHKVTSRLPPQPPKAMAEASSAAVPSVADSAMPSETVPTETSAKIISEISAKVPVSDGTRLSIEGKGFTMAPPSGWIIRKDLPRNSLFLQPEKLSAEEYPRNISVIKFPGPMAINEASAEKFSQYLEKNFPSVSQEIEDYRLRNNQSMQMADGREGLLFYSDFTVHGKAMMQANVLVSSETDHYLISFTDVAEHFENPQGDSEFLATAWAAMTSIQLDSPNPQPMESLRWTFIGIGLVVIIGGAVSYARNRAAGSVYRDYGDLEPGEGAELDPKTSPGMDESSATSGLSAADFEQSKIIEFRGKNSKKLTEVDSQDWRLDGPEATAPISKSDDEIDEEIPRDQWKVS